MLILPGVLVALCGFAVGAGAAGSNAPGWEIVSPASYPSTVQPSGKVDILVPVFNIGALASSEAEPITVTDKLPPGLTAVEAGFVGSLWKCTVAGVVSCTNNPAKLLSINPGEMKYLLIRATASSEASGSEVNEVTVSGGGASAPATAKNTIRFGVQAPQFGLQSLDSWFSTSEGGIDMQAGSHPYALTLAFAINNKGREPAGEMRDVVVDAPPGIVGDPQAPARCTRSQLNANECPADSQIGIDQVVLSGVNQNNPVLITPVPTLKIPLYNMVPPPGVPAEFGFQLAGSGARLDAAVRTGGDYGISVHINNITQKAITFNAITFWGVPGDSSHDAQRCETVEGGVSKCGLPTGVGQTPFLTLPTQCAGPLSTFETVTSWAPPGQPGSGVNELEMLTHNSAYLPEGLSGCDRLQFGPSLDIAPDTSSADTPAGLTVDVKMPQEGLVNREGLSMSDIKNTTVTLPEGVVINPGQATGLGVCSDAQSAVGTEGEPSCPSSSKMGVDSIDTPLLPHKLEGNVYLLQSEPPDLKLLVAASGEGVNLKLVGHVHLDENTGRLVTTFTETPELPFTDFKLSFSGGAQAALATPTQCGTYTSTSDFTPWSTPSVQDAFPSSAFAVEHGPGGSACPGGTLPFSPTLTAGATTDQAGGFTGFSMLLTRPDGQQRIDGLQFKAPPGLTGTLTNVPLCTNAQAETNTCPEASKIGHTVVESGPGPYPLVVPESGQPQAPIYLTEGYHGAPFGLSIVVPLHVGPFTLPTQRVRAKIEVDPNTAQLTITTDSLPQVVAGVPTDLRAVDAVIDRADFMINPTSCEPQEFSGTAYGAPPPGAGGSSASAAIGSHFQVGSCQALRFQPKFTITTNGKTSKANGAGLDVKLSFPSLPQGSQANVRTVKVELPKQLPSRLTTLQKACTEAQFNANPAGCPAASVIGHATASTPILPVPLTGPAYFVSHGGAKFPELIMVLQGYGLTIMLHGETFISKAGITSSTFHAVPDQPVSSFELTLPQGPNSALAANGSLCASKLAMPTELIGQNGAFIERSTPIAVSGCAKTKALTRAQKLARALKACHKQPKGAKRVACERAARKKYGPAKRKKK